MHKLSQQPTMECDAPTRRCEGATASHSTRKRRLWLLLLMSQKSSVANLVILCSSEQSFPDKPAFRRQHSVFQLLRDLAGSERR